MQVHVRLFAIARQLAHQDDLEVDLPDSATLGDLRATLGRLFPPLAPVLPLVLFALNTEYADDNTPIPANSEVACIPPVSGG